MPRRLYDTRPFGGRLVEFVPLRSSALGAIRAVGVVVSGRPTDDARPAVEGGDPSEESAGGFDERERRTPRPLDPVVPSPLSNLRLRLRSPASAARPVKGSADGQNDPKSR